MNHEMLSHREGRLRTLLDKQIAFSVQMSTFDIYVEPSMKIAIILITTALKYNSLVATPYCISFQMQKFYSI